MLPSSRIPKVEQADRAKPRSPPEKGFPTQITNTATPREFTLSVLLPRHPASRASMYMMPLRTAETGNAVNSRKPRIAPAVSRFFPTRPMGSLPNRKARKAASAAMCRPEITKRW